MEYIIIHEDGIIALQNRVNEYMEEGYVPNGSLVVAVVKNSINPLYCQPMILQEQGCECESCKVKRDGN